MAVGDVVETERTSRYHVEIRHDGGDWHGIHPPGWEETEDLTVVRPFAEEVRSGNPAAEVRIIETDSVKITNQRTGEVSWLGRDTKVQTYL